jgi:hypothetical protein
LRSTGDSRTGVSDWAARGFAFLTGAVVVLAVGHTLQPQMVVVADFVLPVLFGACLVGSVAADASCNRLSDDAGASRAARIRRASRLVYLWLYVLFGADEVAAWMSDCPIESAAVGLRRFLVAGIVVLVMIRVSRVALAVAHRERRAAR